MDEDGNDVAGFGQVDHDRLQDFVLVPLRDGLPPAAVHVTPGMRVRFLRRRRKEVSLVTEQVVDERTVHVLGWDQTVRDVTTTTVLFLLESGHLLLSDDLEAVQ